MRVLILSLILVFSLGCENPFLSNPSGTFTAAVTGAVSATLEGRAEVGNPRLGVTDSYSISLTPPDGRAIYFYSGSRLQPGNFAIVPFEIETPRKDYTAVLMSEGNGGGYTPVSGTMQIVKVSGGLRGTFRFEAEDRPDRPRITISGTFTVM